MLVSVPVLVPDSDPVPVAWTWFPPRYNSRDQALGLVNGSCVCVCECLYFQLSSSDTAVIKINKRVYLVFSVSICAISCVSGRRINLFSKRSSTDEQGYLDTSFESS